MLVDCPRSLVTNLGFSEIFDLRPLNAFVLDSLGLFTSSADTFIERWLKTGACETEANSAGGCGALPGVFLSLCLVGPSRWI